MKRISILAFVAVLALSCKVTQKEVSTSEATVVAETINESASENDWTALSLDHWQAFKGGELPKFWKKGL